MIGVESTATGYEGVKYSVAGSPKGSEKPWVPLVLTYVEYIKGDWIGLFFAFTSLAPVTIFNSFFALILFRRDLHTISFFIGFLLMEPINVVLKQGIGQSRPLERAFQHGDFGMPSSHAQHLWFFTMHSILFILIRLRRLDGGSMLENMGLIVVLVIHASLVSYGRVYLQYHTWMQILIGGLVGSIFGGLWFALVHLVLTPIFPSIVTWKISQYLLIRDTTNIPNLLSFEYNNVIQASQPLPATPGDDELALSLG